MSNRLAQESSPYLLQHKDNPVDWYPWGPEALEKSKSEDKPIFLSIGYSSCHWCHVMEHESFENQEIADFLNENFVSIKVDREERPDLDQIYMQAVMALRGGGGGWPLSAFLTPKCEIFFGGTYWPETSRRGMPGFDHVLKSVLDAFRERRDQVDDQAGQITEHLRNVMTSESSSHEIGEDLLVTSAVSLERSFDFRNGGFGSAPKFPHAMDLQLLMRLWKRWEKGGGTELISGEQLLKMVRVNLDKMYQGGIYDHLAGGFSRYSVDEKWLVPHFEKMLYDNALLIECYLDGYLITGDEKYRAILSESFGYIKTYMTDPAGGYFSAEDADSEGVEGKFYVWSKNELVDILSEHFDQSFAAAFCTVYDVTESGNFEGANILNLPMPLLSCLESLQLDESDFAEKLGRAKEILLAIRDKRIRPGLDDKVLVSWNGLMIHALARAGRSLKDVEILESAQKAARFILDHVRQENGELFHTWRGGVAKLNAYLDDYANFCNSLITLYESDFDSDWLDAADELIRIVVGKFYDPTEGGFFYVSEDHEELLTRNKDVQDSSVPSGNSMMATVLVRFGKLTGNEEYLEMAKRTIQLVSTAMERSPMAFGQMLVAHESLTATDCEMVFATSSREEAKELAAELHSRYAPNVSLAASVSTESDENGLLQKLIDQKDCVEGQPTLYVCQSFACQNPVVGETAIQEKLKSL